MSRAARRGAGLRRARGLLLGALAWASLAATGCAASATTLATPTREGQTVTIPAFGPATELTFPEPPAVAPAEPPPLVLGEVDVGLLAAIGKARALESHPARATDRAAAWQAVLAAMPTAGESPFRSFAEERAKAWATAGSAETQRDASREKLRTQYQADWDALTKLVARATPAQADAAEERFASAYARYEGELAALDLGTLRPLPEPVDPSKPKPRTPTAPLADPLGPADVVAQRFVLKSDFGAHLQSFSVDTADDTMVNSRGQKPTYDLSGFYAGGDAIVNVADESGFAIGLLLTGRYHVTTQLPDATFQSGDAPSKTVVPADGGPTGAFVAGGGVRLSGNLLPRIGLELGLSGGYAQFLAPSLVPGCGPSEASWDPALRGFQADLSAGAEFYPMALLSFGVAGKVGFGHMAGEWCVPAVSAGDVDAPQDVTADSFSVGGQGSIGLHF